MSGRKGGRHADDNIFKLRKPPCPIRCLVALDGNLSRPPISLRPEASPDVGSRLLRPVVYKLDEALLVVHAEFAVDVARVHFDGALGDAGLLLDEGYDTVACEAAEHFQLAW